MPNETGWTGWENDSGEAEGDRSADWESAGDDGIVIRLEQKPFETGESIETEESFDSGESFEAGESFEEAAPASHVRARILWPALGFPAVIAPRADATGSPMQKGDAARCVTVLLLSDRKALWQNRKPPHTCAVFRGPSAPAVTSARNVSLKSNSRFATIRSGRLSCRTRRTRWRSSSSSVVMASVAIVSA